MRAFTRIVVAASLLAFSTLSYAGVQSPREGLVVDKSRAPLRRGVEILHPLRIDRAKFEGAARTGGAWLPTRDGSPMFARYSHAERHRNGDWTWVGRVDTRLGEQSVVITFGKDAVYGNLPQRQGAPLRIQTYQGRHWVIENVPQYKHPAPGHKDSIPQPRDASGPRVAAAPPPGRVTPAVAAQVDVLVAYTPSFVTENGGESQALTRINFIAAIANTAYVDSGAQMHINLVAVQAWNHTAAVDNSTVLNLIRNPSADPLKVQIDSWRNQFGADLVAVVRGFSNSTQSNCGLAYVLGSHGDPFAESYAFSVSSDGTDEGFYCFDQTFAHELGHNMGSAHDLVTDGGDYGAYTFSRGHRAGSGASGFATVMAYPEGDQEVLSIFSNPLMTTGCLGQPCGVADESDNAQGFTLSGPYLAAFRATVSQPSLSIADVSVSEGNAGTKLLTFTVSLSAASGSAVTYSIATANGSATAGSDYVASSLTGETIAAGATSKTFSVTINGDAAIEADETFTVAVSAVTGAIVGDGNATGTITNDDVPSLTIADASVSEGNAGTKLLTFTVSLSAASGSAVTYSIATSNGSATAGSDYVASSLTGQTIAAGATSKTFAVTINGDAAIEPAEDFTVTVSAVTGATVTDGIATGTITNDDGPTLTIADVSLAEGNGGAATMTFTVKLSSAAVDTVTFNIGTANTTATAGSDYTAVSLAGQTIAPGVLTKTFNVTVSGDTTAEPNETFRMIVSNVTGSVSVGDNQAIGTILNDDGPVVTINDAGFAEGNSGLKSMGFTVTLSEAVASPVTFNFATTIQGTATSGVDYVPRSLTGQTIPAGQLAKTITVSINGDTTPEPNENFISFISNVTGPATVLDDRGTATILNDDGPTLSVADVFVTEGNVGTKTANFIIKLNAVAAVDVTFNVATAAGTATAGTDYVTKAVVGVTIPAGSTQYVFPVTLNGDAAIEANETFTVNISNIVNGTAFDGQAVGTIINDEGTLLSIADKTITEGNAGLTLMTFIVTVNPAPATQVNFCAQAVTNTALSGSDFNTLNQCTYTIAAGVTTKAVNVNVIGDTAVEANEQFYLLLSNVTGGATVYDDRAVGTITNDD